MSHEMEKAVAQDAGVGQPPHHQVSDTVDFLKQFTIFLIQVFNDCQEVTVQKSLSKAILARGSGQSGTN
jgi:hypothetical protein